MSLRSFNFWGAIISFLLISCSEQPEAKHEAEVVLPEKEITEPTHTEETTTPTGYSVQVIEVGSNQFGYDILMNGQPYIHQPHIPAVGGNNGFSTKEKAELAGNFVIQKLENNIMPPTISVDELDSLGVLN